MKDDKHTRGPWEFFEGDSADFEGEFKNDIKLGTICGDGWGIANIHADVGEDDEVGQAEANARLIAAAPDLLEACRAVEDQTISVADTLLLVRAAILKATSAQAEGGPP